MLPLATSCTSMTILVMTISGGPLSAFHANVMAGTLAQPSAMSPPSRIASRRTRNDRSATACSNSGELTVREVWRDSAARAARPRPEYRYRD